MCKTYKEVLNSIGAEKVGTHLTLLNDTYYHKCTKCRGIGIVKWGKCYDCDGCGIVSIETVEAYNSRIAEIDKQRTEYMQSDEYHESQLNGEYLRLVNTMQHHDNATDWESKFAYSLNCSNRNKVSQKQKEVLIKIAKKLLSTSEQKTFSELLGI